MNTVLRIRQESILDNLYLANNIQDETNFQNVNMTIEAKRIINTLPINTTSYFYYYNVFVPGTYEVSITISRRTTGGFIIADSDKTTANAWGGLFTSNGNFTFDVNILYPHLFITTGVSTFTDGELKINYVRSKRTLEIDCNNIQIPVSYGITDLSNLNARTIAGSMTVTIPDTPNNRKEFDFVFMIENETNKFMTNRKHRFFITNNTIDSFEGVISLDEIRTLADGSREYDVTLFGAENQVYDLWGDLTLKDLDMREYNHEYTMDNVLNSWRGINKINGSDSNTITSSSVSEIISVDPISNDDYDYTVTYIEFNNVISPLNVGDIVSIYSLETNVNDVVEHELNGYHTIIEVIGNTEIVISAAFKTAYSTSALGLSIKTVKHEGAYIYGLLENGTINNEVHDENKIKNGIQISGQLIIGIWYIIKDYHLGDNFSNCGAINSTGQIFKCTSSALNNGSEISPTNWTHNSVLVRASAQDFLLQDFIPSFYLKKVLDKCFSLINKTYSGDYVSAPLFSRVLLNGNASFKDLIINQALKDKLEFQAWQTTPINGTYIMEYVPNSVIGNWLIVADGSGNYIPCQGFDYRKVCANSLGYDKNGDLITSMVSTSFLPSGDYIRTSFGLGYMWKGVSYTLAAKTSNWYAISEVITITNSGGSLPFTASQSLSVQTLSPTQASAINVPTTLNFADATLPASGAALVSLISCLDFLLNVWYTTAMNFANQTGIYYFFERLTPTTFRIRILCDNSITTDVLTSQYIPFYVPTGAGGTKVDFIPQLGAAILNVQSSDGYNVGDTVIADSNIENDNTPFVNFLTKPLDAPRSHYLSHTQIQNHIPLDSEIDLNSVWDNTNSIYTMPSGYGTVIMSFNISAKGTNYIKNPIPYSSPNGDLPSDYSNSASGNFALQNGKMINGIYSEDIITNINPVDADYDPIIANRRGEFNADGFPLFSQNYIQIQVDRGSGYEHFDAIYANLDNGSSFKNWENSSYINANIVIELNAGDKVKFVYKIHGSCLALNSSGRPCVGTSITGINGGVRGTWSLENFIIKNTVLNVLNENVEFDLASALPSIKIKDFFNGILNKFNLIYENNNGVLKIEQQDLYYLNNTNKIYPIVDETQPRKISTMNTINKKTYSFKNTPLTGIYNQQYLDLTGLNYGDYDYNNRNDYATGSQDITIPFSPLINSGAIDNYQSTDKIFAINCEIDENFKTKKSNVVSLGILNVMQRVAPINIYATSGYVKDYRYSFNVTSPANTYYQNKFYPAILAVDDLLGNSFDINFGKLIYTFYTVNKSFYSSDVGIILLNKNKTLFNTGYRKSFNQRYDKNSRMLICNVMMRIKDIITIDFGATYIIDGVGYRLQGISNYDHSIEAMQSVECEFLKIL